jgi:hypothetical protein
MAPRVICVRHEAASETLSQRELERIVVATVAAVGIGNLADGRTRADLSSGIDKIECPRSGGFKSPCQNQLLAGQKVSQPEIAALGFGPSEFLLTAGKPLADASVFDAALFFQDDWRAPQSHAEPRAAI